MPACKLNNIKGLYLLWCNGVNWHALCVLYVVLDEWKAGEMLWLITKRLE